MNRKKTISLFVAALLIGGCSVKEEQLSNKSANFWYQKIVNSVAIGNLNFADEHYSSLYSEHVSSPLLAQAMLLLSKAHAYYDELILAKYYLDEYLKRFGDEKEREYVEFLKVKISYMAYRHPNRNQKFLDETIDTIKTFKSKYPDSYYLPSVEQMLVRLELGRELLKEHIVALYERIEKPKAAQYYKEKNRLQGIDKKDMELPERSWLRSLFE